LLTSIVALDCCDLPPPANQIAIKKARDRVVPSLLGLEKLAMAVLPASMHVESHHGLVNTPHQLEHTGQIQRILLTKSGSYRIDVIGGEGGRGQTPLTPKKKKSSLFRSRSSRTNEENGEAFDNPPGGEGARLAADFFLSEGTLLWVSVGAGGEKHCGGGCSIVAQQVDNFFFLILISPKMSKTITF
jgi:hypothetical protein